MTTLTERACKALKEMPHYMQYSYAFGVIGGAITSLSPDELNLLYKNLSEAINETRGI